MVRLAGNNRLSNAGRLEIYYNDTWGTVCDDGFDGKDAQVACYMLGFRYIWTSPVEFMFTSCFLSILQNNHSSLYWHRGSISWRFFLTWCNYRSFGEFLRNAYGGGTGQIWLDDVHCTGHELSLAECAHSGWGVHNCLHHEDVSILCDNGKFEYSHCSVAK